MKLHSTSSPSAHPARQGGVFLFLALALAAAAGAYQMGLFDSLLDGEEEVVIEGAPVRRGDLRISEVVRGNLEATDSVSIRSELEGRSTIIFLAEEGSQVKEGDLVVELDVSQLEDDLVRQEIEVKNAQASFTKAREQYDIQEIQNRSDLAAAELALELAELDLAKYVGTTDEDGNPNNDGEYQNEQSTARDNVYLKEEELTRAKTELEWSDKLLAEDFIPQSENDSKRLALEGAQIRVQQAKRELDLLNRFSYRRKFAELEANVETRKRDIEKVRKQALARLADFEAERESAAYKLTREQNQLQELRDQVGKAKIYAPEPGLLVYARERSRWGSGDVIEEGQEVRERQELLTIPRQGGMTVKASIHETKLKKIDTGQPCIVTVDAFPGRTFEGRVEFVAVMADSGSWRSNPNQRLYKADISLTNPTPEMRPGMSTSVEILIDDLENAHYVPRQCVYLDGGETIVFVVEGGSVERRTVEVGLDNSKWVSIESGLKEGEVVALAPPADFEPAPLPESEAPDFGQREESGKPSQGGPPAKGGRPSSGRPAGGRPSSAAAGGESGGGRPASSYGKGKGKPGASVQATPASDKAVTASLPVQEESTQ